MSRDPRQTVRWFWIWALALETAAFSLACRLVDTADSGAISGDSIVTTVLGESRLAVSDAFYEEADVFFHRGVGHYRPKAFSDVFVKLGRDIAPDAHLHLTDKDVLEIVPWLYLAVRMDSRNVTAYAVAAFWLAGEAGRPDLAAHVLAEARRANPRDYRVYLESGRLAIKQVNLKRAAAYLETALRLCPVNPGPKDRQSQLDLAEIFMYRGLLYEDSGDLAQAEEMYRRALQLVPQRTALQKRLIFLETHGRSPSPPFEVWQSMLFHHAQVCDKEQAEQEKGYGP